MVKNSTKGGWQKRGYRALGFEINIKHVTGILVKNELITLTLFIF